MVSISEASRILGVSEATLRLWSNEGQIRTLITPGGHRRYRPEELKRIVSSRRKALGLNELTQQFNNTALVHRELADSIAHRSWCRELTSAQSQELLALGQSMLNLMLKYLTLPSRRPETLAIARAKGEEFGVAVAGIGLSLTDSVETFTQHRGHVMHFITRVLSQKTSPNKRAAQALELVTELMDEALITMIAAHQRLSRAAEKPSTDS